MNSLLAKQIEISEQISRNYTNYRKSPKERLTKSYIETRCSNLEALWTMFTEYHFEIIGLIKGNEKSTLSYFTDDLYGNTEENYIMYNSKLKDDLNDRSSVPVSSKTGSTPAAEVKLPRIKLPSFSGIYEEWQTFYDMFVSLIHNNLNLSAVQKLHYLKSSLIGEPEVLLRDLTTTENNYEEAWSKLKKRYNNKKYNSNEIFKRLFSQKTITSESAVAIKQILDTTSACLKSLKNLGIDTDSWDTIINYLVVSKLDYESRRLWESEICHNDDLPTWDDLTTFLERRFRSLEMLQGAKATKTLQNSTSRDLSKTKSFHSAVHEETKEIKTCTLCQNNHLLYQCKQFGTKTPKERSEFVQIKGLCYNCLSPTHNVRGCHQATCCRRCGRRHHTLLHIERRPQEATKSTITSPESLSQEENSEKAVVAHFAKEKHQSEVLLATALVKVKSTNGYSQIARALLDQGSEASFISEHTVQSLGLKRIPTNGFISGVGNSQARTKSMVEFNLESLHNSKFSLRVNAFVLSSLTSFLPSRKTSIIDWPEINNLPIADPKYGSPGKIDIILGVDVHSAIMLDGLLKHPSQSGPIAQNTQLGWILSGRVSNQDLNNPRVINLHLQVKEDQLLRQFWEIEREPNMIEIRRTKEEERCEEIFEKTTVRNEEGRYIVRLPFKESDPRCIYGKTKEIALRRYQLLERKLKKNKSLKEEYNKAIQDYIDQNHMAKIETQEEINNPYVVYLPHHAVVREERETTKVRVVFDASCKGFNNVSLNDTLLVGPKLQQDLRHILMRWRIHRFCVVSDLKQMYRQILVNENDADFQRILWRPDDSQPVQHYKHLRLTFGTACAPYLAVKCLQQLAKDESSEYPLASKITLEDYYMDDLLTGCETEDEAIEIYEQMNGLMKKGGFHLQKWCSNSNKLLQYIEQEKQRSNESFVFKTNNMIKVLGITWNKISDSFEYVYSLPEIKEPVTKRNVLSDIARLYDPLGWIAPVIIVAKIFIQKLWKSGLQWDDQLPPDLLREWLHFRGALSKINMIVIPRWLNTFYCDDLELHAFADASQKAYAAVVYLKIKNAAGIYVKLLTAKTKVAPVEKEISIPRMELCAALLATTLIHEVSQVMKVPKDKLFAWSDSTVVLAWLNGEPSRWKTFVSNRVSEILTILDRENWHHVGTDHNPADCASRGTSVIELADHRLWWDGPEFLRFRHNYEENLEFDTNEEERPIKTLTAVVNVKEEFIWERFSSLSRLLRVLSYCRKFLSLKLPKEQRSSVVSVKEMSETLNTVVKLTQELYFAEEIKQLKSIGYVSKRSPLHTLCPFLDEKGVLRVSGRINECEASFDKKHPMIIPGDSKITKLIVLDAHHKTLHGGPQIMMNFLRSKYWIIRGRDRVKKCYRECVTCTRYSRRNNNQFMGQLPKARLTPDKPFRSSGVDFTGYINIRFSPGRGSKTYKGYVCLFICMATKAIHLEAVSDLTSAGFIAAFRRFVSRRGSCQHLYSDNGTNFVGAEKELREMLVRAKSQLHSEISHLLTNEGEPLVTVPDESFSDITNISGLQRWKLTQKMINDFWRKWSNEYLVNLNQRYKWTMKRSEPEIDDVVIVRDSNVPPAKWLLGRVIDKHPGKDDVTRVVTLKTKNGVVKRPCNKLCFLPRASVSD